MFTPNQCFSFSRVAVTYIGGCRTRIWQLWNLDRCQDELWQEASLEFFIRCCPSLVNLQRNFYVRLVESRAGIVWCKCQRLFFSLYKKMLENLFPSVLLALAR